MKKNKKFLLALLLVLLAIAGVKVIGKVTEANKIKKLKVEFQTAMDEALAAVYDDEKLEEYQITDVKSSVVDMKKTDDRTYTAFVVVDCTTEDQFLPKFEKSLLAYDISDYVPGQYSDHVSSSTGDKLTLVNYDVYSGNYGRNMLTINVNGEQALAPEATGDTSGKGAAIFADIALYVAIFILAALIIGMSLGYQEKKELQVATNKLDFYKECIENDIRECKSEKDRQRATLIAQKREIEFSDITVLFSEAKAAYDKECEKKQGAQLEQKKQAERQECASLEVYAKYTGREKRIAFLNALRADYLAKANAINNGATGLLNSTQQKEHDWATHGGIASGIAGPVAGAVTAANIQEKNAQIRAQNAANIKAMAPFMLDAMSKASDYEKKANNVSSQIEKEKVKLISAADKNTCFSKLKFKDTKVEVSETGTCTVTTRAALSEPLIIFDDVKAVMDGTIKAHIYDAEKEIGTALMVIPARGIATEVVIKGMSLFTGTQGKEYTVKFEPENLWEIEQSSYL